MATWKRESIDLHSNGFTSLPPTPPDIIASVFSRFNLIICNCERMLPGAGAPASPAAAIATGYLWKLNSGTSSDNLPIRNCIEKKRQV